MKFFSLPIDLIREDLLKAGFTTLDADKSRDALLKSGKFVIVYTQRFGLIRAKLIRSEDSRYFWIKPKPVNRKFLAMGSDYFQMNRRKKNGN